MTTFYIVRHGNTEFNKKEILIGQMDSPLTKQGYKDAFIISKKLKKMQFDAIFSSDLGRAFITSYLISKQLELTKNINLIKEFREIDMGDLAGRKKEDIKEVYKKTKKNSKIKYPNGESHLDVKKRVLKKLYGISKIDYKNVLIVTHNNCIRSIMSEALNKRLESLLEKKIPHTFIAKFEISNNKIIKFKIIN